MTHDELTEFCFDRLTDLAEACATIGAWLEYSETIDKTEFLFSESDRATLREALDVLAAHDERLREFALAGDDR